jgi:hypothetical protein
MKHRTNKALFAYWNSVRAERIAPQRFEIDPSRISAILPHTFILERIDAETFRYRLAGTRMCEIFGCELRGTNFLDGWAAMDRLPLLRQFSVLASQGAVMVLDVKLAIVGEESVACEVLLLPLLHTRGTIDRILGSFSPLETPPWLAATPVSAKYLIANELIWPSHDPRAVLTRAPAALEPDVLRQRTARVVRSERRQFRVVEGGRSGSEIDES